jgi:hypothetical protein
MSHQFLNAIIEKRGYQTYLEIGIDNPDATLNHVNIAPAFKTAVDPYSDQTGCHLWNEANKNAYKESIQEGINFVEATSDDFFSKLKKKKGGLFDLIYIDGLHLEEQVDKDIENSLLHLKKGGMIVLDDVPPANEYEGTPTPTFGQPWRGTVWRSFAKLRMEREDLPEVQFWGCIQ